MQLICINRLVEFMKGTSFSIPSLPVGKVGFVLGSVIAGQWIINDLVHIPSGGLAVLAAGAGLGCYQSLLKVYLYPLIL